jgi:gliding motility-associated lipoprotein GldH
MIRCKKTSYSLIFILMASAILICGCRKEKDREFYHPFRNHTWQRFDKLTFEIPLERSGKPYDIYFFVRHTREYEFDNLDFNMIMNTPSGEERIKEYSFRIRRDGSFTGKCTGDSCEAVISLKKEMFFSSGGILRIEIENLVPRLETKNLLGVGIRLRTHSQ